MSQGEMGSTFQAIIHLFVMVSSLNGKVSEKATLGRLVSVNDAMADTSHDVENLVPHQVPESHCASDRFRS